MYTKTIILKMKKFKFFRENKDYRTKRSYMMKINTALSEEEIHKSIRKHTLRVAKDGDYDEVNIVLDLDIPLKQIQVELKDQLRTVF